MHALYAMSDDGRLAERQWRLQTRNGGPWSSWRPISAEHTRSCGVRRHVVSHVTWWRHRVTTLPAPTTNVDLQQNDKNRTTSEKNSYSHGRRDWRLQCFGAGDCEKLHARKSRRSAVSSAAWKLRRETPVSLWSVQREKFSVVFVHNKRQYCFSSDDGHRLVTLTSDLLTPK